jgi:hypothetical protein
MSDLGAARTSRYEQRIRNIRVQYPISLTWDVACTKIDTLLHLELLKLAILRKARPGQYRCSTDEGASRPNNMLVFGTLLKLPILLGTSVVDATGTSFAASKPTCDSSSFSYPVVDGATIISLSATLQTNYSTPSSDVFPSFINLNICEVNITSLRPMPTVMCSFESGSRVRATTGIHVSRLLVVEVSRQVWAVGLAPAVQQGYAAVSTDGGPDECNWTTEAAARQDRARLQEGRWYNTGRERVQGCTTV